MNRQEHFERGEHLLDRMDSGQYDTDERLVLAAKAQAHFLAALAAPTDSTREPLTVDGVFEA